MFFVKDYLFFESGERGEKERERNIDHLPTGDLACNPGVCPDWESNLLVRRPALNLLSHTSQSYINVFNSFIYAYALKVLHLESNNTSVLLLNINK